MTDNQVGELILVILAFIFLIRPSKPRNAPAPQMVYFEMIEVIEIRKRRKVPQVVVNLVIAAVFIAFVLVMNRS